jgi:ATP-dependent RNA helicase DHX29
MLEGKESLGDVTHIIIDEVHERSIDSDFLLIVLREILEVRKDLKYALSLSLKLSILNSPCFFFQSHPHVCHGRVRFFSPTPFLLLLTFLSSHSAEKIADYMGGCPVVRVPGRTFPVTPYYLEDVVELTRYRLDPHSDSQYVARNKRSTSSVSSLIRLQPH